MSRSAKERSQAAYYRRLRDAGKTIPEEKRTWLESYEASQRRGPRPSSATSSSPSSQDSSSAAAPDSARSSGSAKLLAVPEVTSAPAATAVPMLPPAPPPEGAAPPPEGSPTPPDEAVVTEEKPGPTEAELAAGGAKLALGVQALAAAGLKAALELAPADLPYLDELSSEKAQAQVLELVGAAAARLAVKYNLTLSVPYEDELLVAGAVGGSVAAMLAVRRRRAAAQVGPMTDAARAAKDANPTPGTAVEEEPKLGAWADWMEGAR